MIEGDLAHASTATVSRRAFLGGLLGAGLLAPLAARAQQPDRFLRIGMLERTSIAVNAVNVQSFRHGLRDLGYVEGEHFVIEYRSAEGQDQRYPGLVSELARLKVDLIVTRGTPAALAAKSGAGAIPVVIIGVGDPVGQRLVESLAHPGGNVTGLSAAVTQIYPKRVQLLRELVPRATRLGALLNMSNPALPSQWREIEKTARSIDIEPLLLDVRKVEDLEPAFTTAARLRVDAMIVGLDTLTQANQWTIVDLAAKYRLPAMYASTEFAHELVAYEMNYPEMYRRAAGFAHKIFRGARPADLPVEEPTAFELVINLRTARSLGLTIPPSLLLRADHVVE